MSHRVTYRHCLQIGNVATFISPNGYIMRRTQFVHTYRLVPIEPYIHTGKSHRPEDGGKSHGQEQPLVHIYTCIKQRNTHKYLSLHRAIALTWLDLRIGDVVDHINTNVHDWRIVNLECVSVEENVRRAVITRRLRKQGINPVTDNLIYQHLNIPSYGDEPTNPTLSGRPRCGRTYFRPTDYYVPYRANRGPFA